MAQLWYSPISINSAQVPSTQTDFPVLVSVTDARFKDVAHSGHVNRSDGFDIRPYTDTTLGTAITGFELEKYVPTTGELIMWVKVSSLSSSTTPIVLGYGDTGITTDGSSTTTWSSSFIGVYHLKDGTTLNVNSATGSQNGTNHSATATAGMIDGAVAMVSASSQYVDCGNTGTSSMTLTGWFKGTTFPNAYNSTIARVNVTPATAYTAMYVKSNGKLACFCLRSGSDVSFDGTGSTTLSTGTWYYLALTYSNDTTANGGGLKGYINAVQEGAVSQNSQGLLTTASPTYLGNDAGTAGRFWNGSQDEARVASVARSANWITTEYNNQNAPGTFETLGTEVAVGGAASTGNMFLVM